MVFNNFYKVKNKIKESNAFEKKDIIIYLLVLFFLVALFVGFFGFGKKTNANGFLVTVNGKTIISHEYNSEVFNVDYEWESKVAIEKVSNGAIIKISFSQSEYNIIFCSDLDKCVEMSESNCPSQNCAHMQAISNAGAIYCAPRDLKITPLTDNGFIPPVAGGAQ